MRHIEAAGSDSWASLVRRNRERLQLTQQQLADKVGVTRETVGRWESGKLKPTYETATAVIRALGIDREAGLQVAGYGDAEDSPDPYAYVREMGLDPNGRVVRAILAVPGISDEVRLAALRRERQLQMEDEERRLRDFEWSEQQRRAQ